jgi:CheY-like chemotaxis protein
MRELLDRSLGDNIELGMQFEPGLLPVEVDAGELELVVLNLAVNARDAMPGGGMITVKAENVPASDCVRLAVIDTGSGMTPDVQARAVEPFFTTKEVGKGSGLGLAQAYGFARAAGGELRIESELGRGTCIELTLPRSRDMPVDQRTPEAQRETARVRSGRHILLVEDDEEVASLVSDMLEQLGHDVLRASSAPAVLGAVADGRQIDLVFSDIMMAGEMNGLGLAHELRRRFPDLPVLLTSGYADAARGVIEAGRFQVLAKPYRLEELQAALGKMFRAHAH